MAIREIIAQLEYNSVVFTKKVTGEPATFYVMNVSKKISVEIIQHRQRYIPDRSG